MSDDEEVKSKLEEDATRKAASRSKSDESFRLMGRCLGEIVSGGIVAAGVMLVATGLGWLSEFLEQHVHKTDFGHAVFDFVDKTGVVLDATLWLALVSLSLYRLIREMLKL